MEAPQLAITQFFIVVQNKNSGRLLCITRQFDPLLSITGKQRSAKVQQQLKAQAETVH